MTTSSSSEFLALCQAQVQLLTKSLNAAWTVIYLTEDFWHSRPETLNPIVIYPPNQQFWEQDLSPLLFSEKKGDQNLLSLPFNQSFSNSYSLEKNPNYSVYNNSSSTSEIKGNIKKISDFQGKKQIMSPLMYQDSVMGLLITGRNDRDWNTSEIEQIQNIAKTLAIACFLDQRQSWYEKQLIQHQKITLQQQDQLDNLLHQLKNPITALRTFSKLLLKRFLPDNSNYNIAQGIFQESNRLQDLIGNFQGQIPDQSQLIFALPPEQKSLTTSFLLTGNTLNLQELFLPEILSNLLFPFQAIAEEKEINFHHNLTVVKNKLSSIKGNLQALREIFSNLIDNAVKYTPEKCSVYVELGLEKILDNNHYQGIAIHDNGYGIPEQDLDHLFERHYRGVKENGDIPGSGLGLAIVKELIEQMGGKIEIYSPNLYFKLSDLPGTTVIVWLQEN